VPTRFNCAFATGSGRFIGVRVVADPAGQGETAEQGLSAESLRDVRARAEQVTVATADEGTAHFAVIIDGNYARPATDLEHALARDSIALTLSVERLLVRVQELTDERDNAVHGRDLARLDVERERQETIDALRRVQEAERARLSALASVASVLDLQGDDAPATLVDAHRVLATGLAEEDRAVLGGDGQHEPKEDTNG
jgi:hypothetical protein